ncbi:MAG: hypothetical protein ACK46X_00495 [Candidatus Sericytochromatia bacterium]
MALNVNNRPLVTVASPKASLAQPAVARAAVMPAAKPAVATKPAIVAPAKAAAAPASISPAVFTPPVIVDILWQSFKGGFGLLNLVWMVGPSAFRNVRDLTNGKISVGRGAANITTDATIGIGKGILAGAAVQALQIAAGPLLGLIPAAALPFAGIAIGIGGLIGTYWGLGKLVKATGLDTAMSNGLTKLFGGDKPAPAPAAKA